MAIRSSQRLKDANPWGDRVYDANYRGDYVTCVEKPAQKRSRRRSKRVATAETMSLQTLFEIKDSVCPDYVIRLAEDRVPVDFYETQAIDTRKPLFIGIGATQIDRNSIANLALKKVEIETSSRDYVESIKRVANEIAQQGYETRQPPWPGTVYFEDISAESSFELIQIIIDTVRNHGGLGTISTRDTPSPS
jgi:hypothetical protein